MHYLDNYDWAHRDKGKENSTEPNKTYQDPMEMLKPMLSKLNMG